MSRVIGFHCTFLALLALASGCVAPLRKADPQTPFALSVSLPTRHWLEHPRLLYLTRGTHFHVLLENRSGDDVLIWTDDCSAGYDALSFELRDSSGKTFRARKTLMGWTGNVYDCWRVRPGEKLVFNVYLGLKQAGWPDSLVTDPEESYQLLFDPRDMHGWEGFPIVSLGEAKEAAELTRRLWMRAVYEPADDPFAEAVLGAQTGDQAGPVAVWSGIARSEWYEIDLVNVGLQKLREGDASSP